MWKISPPSSTRRAILLVGVALTTSLLFAAAGSDTAKPSRVAREILDEGSYQTDWPEDPGNLDIAAPLIFGEIAFLLLLVGGVVVLVLVAFWLIREFGGAYSDPATQAGARSDAGSERNRGPALAEAERLARDGRYSEAIHQLLLVTIWCLARELDQPANPATTSRELSRLLPLDRPGREAFESIVRRVELTLFGGREADAADYDACRRHHALLVSDSEP